MIISEFGSITGKAYQGRGLRVGVGRMMRLKNLEEMSK
jgi:hypothetical protein